jgi:hypothetical protein
METKERKGEFCIYLYIFIALYFISFSFLSKTTISIVTAKSENLLEVVMLCGGSLQFFLLLFFRANVTETLKICVSMKSNQQKKKRIMLSLFLDIL